MELKKSPVQLLDDTLNHFNDKQIYIGDIFILKDLKPILPVSDFKKMQIMEHLVKEGYIDKSPSTNGEHFFYSISFNGSLFIEAGGYTRQSTKDFPRNRLRTGLINSAALAAGLYYSFEILRIYIMPIFQHVCDCQFVWQNHK